MTLQKLYRILHLQKTRQISPLDSGGVMVDAEGNVDEVEVGRGGIEMVYVVCSGSTLRHFQCWCGNKRHQRGCQATLCEFELLMFSLDYSYIFLYIFCWLLKMHHACHRYSFVAKE